LAIYKEIYRAILKVIKELAAQIINNNNNNKDKITLVNTITFKNIPIIKENTVIDKEVTRYISP
jgi:hypothetical protein